MDHYELVNKNDINIWKNILSDPNFEFNREEKIEAFKN
jgi:hypothetical protein